VAPVPAQSAATAWSDPATWGGVLPPAGAQVVIPPGRAVVLDVDAPPLAGLHIQGALYFADRDVRLTSTWIMVNGLLQVGTEAQPYRHKATITLTGTNETLDVFNMGTKFLGAMGGGRIELHGHRRDAVSWTQLDAHANPGDTAITLAQAVDWRVGDAIAIAPSGFDAREAEKVTITAVAGNRVSFTPALRHRHWGTLQSFDGRTLDQRATVGLLTRDIVIRGDDASDASNFGGHVMVMGGGFARVAGVEFFKMGQAGHQARYPLHWHLVDRLAANGITGAGQYAVGNSFHGGYQRAIVMHGTNNLRAERNVAYLTPNHAYVPAEDGDEEGNVWRHNLAILTRPALNREVAFPAFTNSGPSAGETIQTEGKPAAFWMRNMNQVFVGNVAAGVIGGNGFFFDGFVQFDPDGRADQPTAPFRVQKPARSLVFEDNVAHSLCGLNSEWTEATFSTVARGGWDYSIYEGASNFQGIFVLRGVQNTTSARPALNFVRFTGYKSCGSAAWLETSGEALVDSIVADNHKGLDPRDGPAVRNTVIVGATANDIGGRAPRYYGLLFNDSVGSTLRVENVSFVNITGGALHLTDDISIGAGQLRATRMVNSIPLSGSGDVRGGGANALLDADGTLTGTNRATRISLSPLNAQSVALPVPGGSGTLMMYLTPQ
jgi:cell migration-inducing and hyaluronan-binding protein